VDVGRAGGMMGADASEQAQAALALRVGLRVAAAERAYGEPAAALRCESSWRERWRRCIAIKPLCWRWLRPFEATWPLSENAALCNELSALCADHPAQHDDNAALRCELAKVSRMMQDLSQEG